MLCREAMTSHVFSCCDGDPADTCAQLMRDRDVGFVPVLDAVERPVGIVTDRDLAMRVLAERRPGDTPLYVFMTRDVLTCRPEDDLRVAEATMTTARKSRLVVVDEAGRCVGVLSLSDVARADRSRAGAVLRGVSDREPRRPRARVY
jgi:CBS domain-containing protein